MVLGIDLDGHRDVLGHWLRDGAEGANFWLSVVTDLQARGVEDIFIACIDGRGPSGRGFKEAIHAVFPQAEIQRCIIHQIRHSLQYVAWKDRKTFVADLKAINQASTREEAESQLLQLGETWGKKYTIAVKSWENNWEDLAPFFDYPAEIRRLIYTTNAIECYNRGLRKVVKTKSSFPTPEAVRKRSTERSAELTPRSHAEVCSTWPTRISPKNGRCRSKTGPTFSTS
jgi:transposase-like protein